jgi:hypothetical protein
MKERKAKKALDRVPVQVPQREARCDPKRKNDRQKNPFGENNLKNLKRKGRESKQRAAGEGTGPNGTRESSSREEGIRWGQGVGGRERQEGIGNSVRIQIDDIVRGSSIQSNDGIGVNIRNVHDRGSRGRRQRGSRGMTGPPMEPMQTMCVGKPGEARVDKHVLWNPANKIPTPACDIMGHRVKSCQAEGGGHGRIVPIVCPRDGEGEAMCNVAGKQNVCTV